MRVYLDMCCLKRPFDDQSQLRVRLESEAVLALLAAESDTVCFLRAPALHLENSLNPLPVRAARVARWLGLPPKAAPSTHLQARTQDIMNLGISNFDALHLASAESMAAHVFVTCDDRLLSAARRAGTALRVRVLGILELAAEILK